MSGKIKKDEFIDITGINDELSAVITKLKLVASTSTEVITSIKKDFSGFKGLSDNAAANQKNIDSYNTSIKQLTGILDKLSTVVTKNSQTSTQAHNKRKKEISAEEELESNRQKGLAKMAVEEYKAKKQLIDNEIAATKKKYQEINTLIKNSFATGKRLRAESDAAEKKRIAEEISARKAAIASEKKAEKDLFNFKQAMGKQQLAEYNKNLAAKKAAEAKNINEMQALIKNSFATGKRLRAESDAAEKKRIAEEISARKSLDAQRQKGLAKMAAEEHQVRMLKGTFAGLKQSLAQNIVKYQNLATQNKQNTKAGRELLAVINQQRAAIAKTNAAVSGSKKANTGLLRSVQNITRSLRNLAVAYLGFQTLIRGVQDIFGVTKALDSVNFSQERVIKSSLELAQTQIWLLDISTRYGLDLLAVSERYTKFRAATVSSNLSAQQTQKVFESVSKASAVLGLKTDELRGVYLALEQMISKNKVTTEELRRQLGERLPGAFDIMAKSMGVTTNKLNEMLRAGEVMTEEVLPKFAEEIEKAYGIQSVRTVDTLVAAQNRLRTGWIELVQNMEAGGFFKSFFSTLASIVRVLNDNLDTVAKITKAVIIAIGAFTAWRLGIIATTIATKKLTIASLNLGKALKKNPIGAIASVIMLAWSAIELFRTSVNKTTDVFEDFDKAVSENEKRIEVLVWTLKNVEKGTNEWKKARDEFNKDYGQHLDNLIDEETVLLDIEKAYILVRDAELDRIKTLKRFEAEQEAANTKLKDQNEAISVLRKRLEDFTISDTSKDLIVEKFKDIAKAVSDGVDGASEGYDAFIKRWEEEGGQKISGALFKMTNSFSNFSIFMARIKKEFGEGAEDIISEDVFDIEKFEKGLEKSKKVFDGMKGLSGDTKDQFSKDNKFILEGFEEVYGAKTFKGYESFLRQLLVTYKDNVQARILIRQELFTISKKTRSADSKEEKTALAIRIAQDKVVLSNLKKRLEEELKADIIKKEKEGANKEELDTFIVNQDKKIKVDLLAAEKWLSEQRLSIIEEGSKEEAKAIADIAKLEAEISEWKTNKVISDAQEIFDKKKALREAELDDIDLKAQEEITILTQKAAIELKTAKNERAVRKIEDDLIRASLEVYKQAQIDKLAGTKEGSEEEIRIKAELEKVKTQLAKEGFDKEKELADKKIALQQQIRDKSIEMLMEGFNVFQAFQDRQLEMATRLRDFEVAAAGNSLEKQLIAERKYEKESAKIKTRQAIAAKAQAAVEIVLRTSGAIMQTYNEFGFPAGIPLAIIMAGIGALQLATVLAQPIPAFAEGGDSKGGLAILGDARGNTKKAGGAELVTLPSGDKFLSPATPTIMDLPKGTHIDPHTETQRILDDSVRSTAFQRTDMSGTEKVLKQIRDKSEPYIKDGYKYINRKGISGRYAIGV